MGTVRVEVEPPYDVRVAAGALGELHGAVPDPSDAAVVTDATVASLHRAALSGLDGVPTVVVPAGEGSKAFARLERVLDELAAAGLDRGGTVIALGGGVVGDLAGLAASLYLRGVALVHAPTTLLAQVDASVGGKTAVNLAAGKNLAGTFHQPRAVFADTSALATLPAEEYASGLGEVLKSALIEGEAALARLEVLVTALVARDPDALEEVVESCVRTKARVVAADETEAGPRRALNLGHTFAHAIERAAGYGRLPHGVAVACGLGLALETSRALGLLEDAALPDRVRRLASRLSLPTTLDELRRASGRPLAPDELLDAMRHDKKARAGAPRLVLPRRAGELALDVEAGPGILSELL